MTDVKDCISREELEAIYPFYIDEKLQTPIELTEETLRKIYVELILGFWKGMPSKFLGINYKETGNYIKICKIADLCKQPMWKLYPAGYALENGWLSNL